MGLTYPTLSEKIVQLQKIIADVEELLLKNIRRLTTHDAISSAPMPWESSIGTDAPLNELPHWVTPEEIIPLGLTPRSLWEEMWEVLQFYQSAPCATFSEQLVRAQAVVLGAMVTALERKVEREEKLTDPLNVRVAR